MLDFLFERVQRSRRLERVVLATTDRVEDNRLAEHATGLGLDVFRGPSDDVLGRLVAAARFFNAEPLVLLLGDNPLVDGELIDDVLGLFEVGNYDYVANVTREYSYAPEGLRRFAVGIRVQVMSAEAIARCDRQAATPYNREHATTYIVENPQCFQIGYVEAAGKWAGLNRADGFLAVNTREDYDKLSAIVRWTAAIDPVCGLRSLVWQ